jgi:anti-anti-sigma factor
MRSASCPAASWTSRRVHSSRTSSAGWRFEPLSRVIVDLRGLEFIDSSGIALVLDLAKAAREHNTELVFVRGPHAVQRVLAVSGIDDALTFIDGLDAVRSPPIS